MIKLLAFSTSSSGATLPVTMERCEEKLGVSEVVNGKGYRSLVNVGENGGQEVPHLHFHIFGGEKVGKMVS